MVISFLNVKNKSLQQSFFYFRCSLDLYPEENTWHYITAIPTLSDKIITFGISVVINGEFVVYYIRLYFGACALFLSKMENVHLFLELTPTL